MDSSSVSHNTALLLYSYCCHGNQQAQTASPLQLRVHTACITERQTERERKIDRKTERRKARKRKARGMKRNRLKKAEGIK